MAKTFSGKQVVKIFCKYFGFVVVSQKGSHVKLKRIFGGKNIITIVPMHKELARGTFRGVLDLGEVSEEDFMEFV